MTVTTRRLVDWDMTFGHGAVDYLVDDPAIGQNIQTRLLLFLGEWFLDVTDGTPWGSVLDIKPMDSRAVETVIRQRVLDTDGVTDITAYSFLFDPVSRKATISITVATVNSTVVSVQVTGP
jgi:hypothetical protein